MEKKEQKPGWNINFSSLIIGFLLAACLSLALGAASSPSVGPYQISAGSDLSAYIIDTQTGEAWQISSSDNLQLGTPFDRKSRRKSITPYRD